MNKKIFIILIAVCISIFTFRVANAQSIPQMSPWRVVSGVIEPRNSNNTVRLSTTTAGCTGISATGELYSTGTACGTGGGGGGGSAGGTWSTTTSTVAGQLINYSNNVTDITSIGANSTTTAKFFFDPNTNRFIIKSGNVGIGTTTPYAPLSVVGQVVGSYFTATSTTATSTLSNVYVKTVNDYTVYADQFSGTDQGAKLIAATNALPSTGGIVDARGLTGLQAISSASYTLGKSNGSPVTYIFGNSTTTLNTGISPIYLYDNVTIVGNNTNFRALNSGVGIAGTAGFFSSYTTTTTGTITAGSNSLTVSDASYIKPGKLVGVLGGLGASSNQSTTLNGGIDAVVTTIALTSTTGLSSGEVYTMIVDNEIVSGTLSGSNLVSVTRGLYGTTGASHSTGATIAILRGMVSRVTAVSGTTITLEDSSTLSLTNTVIDIGSFNIFFEGSMTIDGRQNRAGSDEASNPTGILLKFATNVHVGDEVTIKNFDHAGVFLRNAWYNNIGGTYIGIGRPDNNLGFGIIAFLQCKGNYIHPLSIHDTGRFALAIDDRTTGADQYDGAGTYNTIEAGSITASSSIARGDAILLQGALHNRINFGSIYMPNSNGAIELRSTQWTSQPNVANNILVGSSITSNIPILDDTTSVDNYINVAKIVGSISILGDTAVQQKSGFFGTDIGVGTTTPIARLEVVESNNNTTRPIFRVSNVSAFATTTAFVVDASGNSAFGTSTLRDTYNFARAGGAGGFGININNFLTGSGRDIQFIARPFVDSQLGGFVFTTRSGASGDKDALVLSATGNTGLGTTSPYAKLSVEGSSALGNSATAGFFTATTTATSTFTGGIQTNLLNVTSSTASSTFANGISLSGGCFAINGVCISGGGGGGGSSGPVTTTLEADCEPQTDSTDFAPGGAYWQPIYGFTLTNATSSRLICNVAIPKNLATTPNISILPFLTATGTPSTGIAVVDVSATTTNLFQNWYTVNFTDIHAASTTASKRWQLTTGTSLPLNSTTTITLAGLVTPVAGDILKFEITRYGADANDTVDNDVFIPKVLVQLDTN